MSKGRNQLFEVFEMDDLELDHEDLEEEVEPRFFIPSKQFIVYLEHFRTHVKLTRAEWKSLNRFADAHANISAIKPEQYEHLPAKVQHVIQDWILGFKYRY